MGSGLTSSWSALSLSCQFGAWESEKKIPIMSASHTRFSSCQVSLGDGSLEADHVISAVPASGNGVAPVPSQSEAKCSFLGHQDHTVPDLVVSVRV